MKTRTPPVLIIFSLVCFALVQNTQAVNPPPGGGYPGFTTAEGTKALFSLTTGSANTAVGWYSLFTNADGSFNTAVGFNAGSALTTGDNDIDIGADVIGLAGEANTIRIGNPNITSTYIRGVSGATASGGLSVYVTSNGLLGTMTSSARFKEDIKPMDKAS